MTVWSRHVSPGRTDTKQNRVLLIEGGANHMPSTVQCVLAFCRRWWPSGSLEKSDLTPQETASRRNSEDPNAPITADHRDGNGDAQPVDLIA